MVVPLEHVIVLSMILFSIGVLGVLFRRNAITIFMSIELMLNAVNLALVGFSRYYNSVDGQVFVFLVMTLAAAEVAVGLAIIIALYRNRQTVNIDEINLEKAKYLCSLPKIIGQHPENGKDITVNSGRFGPYLKCENKSARLENVEEIFTIGLNRAITLIAEAKPGRISSSLIKDLGEHPEDKKPVRIMKGQYGPYIKYKSLNATIPEEKDPLEINMEDALILIEKRKEYDKNKKKKKK